jgi:hypothetical protein
MVAKYPAIPEPTLDPASLRDSLLSIKQAFEVLTGQRGNQDYRAVLLPELLASDNADDAAIAANATNIAANATNITATRNAVTALGFRVTATELSISSLATRDIVPDAAWTPFAYVNSWVDYSAPYSPAGSRKLSSRLVVLRGLVMSGTAATIATLPVGHRPGIQLLFGAQTNPNVMCRIDISPAGTISHIGGNAGWISLNGITFMAEG